MTTVLGVIPARLAATRFPDKPLARIGDRPMVQWVWEAATACSAIDEVVVATPDVEIIEAVAAFGGDAVLTSDRHATGTDRIAEVAQLRSDVSVVVNIQGDQPFVTAPMLDALVAPFVEPDPPLMTTLAAPLDPNEGPDDPNTVKVLLDRHGDALYFSRAPIPYMRTPGPAPVLHHLGLYAFQREFLLLYAGFSPTPLEEREGLEQLRVLEHGYRIRVCTTEQSVLEVNTPADLERANALVGAGHGAVGYLAFPASDLEDYAE